MSSVICTLFENNYHYGVAIIANSLYNKGYRGEIYAGYRGTLPAWCNKAQDNSSLSWPGAKTLQVADQLQIHFLPLITDYHLTNYKPDFMLNLWDGPAKHASAIFYFDPDMVITQTWSFFEEWIGYGVALCEDMNSPLAQHHPRRVAWRECFGKSSITLTFKNTIYVNGGFVGVSNANRKFIEIWKDIQVVMGLSLGTGGLSQSSLEQKRVQEIMADYHFPFSRTDQDALNATIEAFNGNCSIFGQEAMDFKSGSALMPHAVGAYKPWDANIYNLLFDGRIPRLVDREYWKFAQMGPITPYSSFYVRRKLIALKIAAFFGRFYSR